MPLRVFIVTGIRYGAAAVTAARRIGRRSPRLNGKRGTAAPAGDLRHWAAEVQVDMCDRMLAGQNPHGLADVVRVDAIELHRANRLGRIEREHGQGLLVTFDHPPRRDHFADVQSGTLLRAQPPECRIGDSGHRCQHHRRHHVDRAKPQRPGHRRQRHLAILSIVSAEFMVVTTGRRPQRTIRAIRAPMAEIHQQADAPIDHDFALGVGLREHALERRRQEVADRDDRIDDHVVLVCACQQQDHRQQR